jgi:hypothetical protein
MRTRIAVLLASAGILAGSAAAVIPSTPATPVAYNCSPAFPSFCLFHHSSEAAFNWVRE